MRGPFVVDPKAEKRDLEEGLGELMCQSHALIKHLCTMDGAVAIDSPDTEVFIQLLWTLNTMIDQAKEITDKLEL